MGLNSHIWASRVKIPSASSSNAARATTPPGSAWPISAPFQVALSLSAVRGCRKVYFWIITGGKGCRICPAGEKVEVSQASLDDWKLNHDLYVPDSMADRFVQIIAQERRAPQLFAFEKIAGQSQ